MFSKVILGYLLEFRKRMLRILVVGGVGFLVSAAFSTSLYHYLALPLVRLMAPEVIKHALIATSIMAPVVVPLKCALMAALIVTMPYMLFEMWSFIAPALYRREKKFLCPLIVSSSVLFYVGAAFAYFAVVPLVFQFVLSMAPAGVEVKPDISMYLSFMLQMFVAFGLSFELPVAVVLLVGCGVVSVQSLAKKRPYVIVALLIMSMLLTPPDIFSQVLLALPMWFLFEVGLFIGRRVERRKLAEVLASR